MVTSPRVDLGAPTEADDSVTRDEPTPGVAVGVAVLDLSVRSTHVLEALGISTLAELCELTPDEILAHRSAGRLTIKEISRKLAELGLRLREPGPKGAGPPERSEGGGNHEHDQS